MKKLSVLVTIVGITCWCSYGIAQEGDRTGAGISAMMGGSFCVENGDADCTHVDPSFGFSVSAGYRLMDYVGAGLDFIYSMYDVPSADASNMGLMIGPVVYFPLDQLDLFCGLGLGWMRATVEAGGTTANADGFGLGIHAGIEYRVIKNLGLGVMFRFHFNFADELCAEGDCIDVDEVAHNAIVGGRISVYF